MSNMPMEPRLAHLEGLVDQIGDRLNSIDARITSFESRVERRFESMDRRFEAVDRRFEALEMQIHRFASSMDARFTWTIGLIAVSIVLPVVQRFALR